MSTNRHREIARRIADVACSYEHKIPDAEDKIEAILQEYFGAQVKSFEDAARAAAEEIANHFNDDFMTDDVAKAGILADITKHFAPIAELQALLIQLTKLRSEMHEAILRKDFGPKTKVLANKCDAILNHPLVAAAIRAGETGGK